MFGPPPTNPIVIPAHPPQIQIPFGVAPIHVPFDAAASIGSVAVLPQAHVPMLPVATTGPAPAPAFGSNPVNQPSAPAGGAPAVFPAPTTLGPTHAAPPQGTVLKPRPSPPPVVGPVPSQGAPVELNEQTLKLHQSYMNALQQHPSLFRDPQQPTSSLQTSTSATRSEPAAQAAASGPGVGKPLPWRPSQPLHSGNATIAESRNGSTSESQSNAPVRLVAPMQHQRSVPVPIAGPALGPPALPPPSPIDPLKDLASSAPDFLSGFDRVALSLKPSPCDTEKLASLPQPQGDLHCSPTFTSRSFDDFHRFLGQDLVHLGSPARPPTGQDIDFLRPRAGSESAPPMFPIHAATEAPSAFVAKRPSAPVLSLAANGGSNIDVPSGGDVEQVLLRSNSQEVNSMFSADSYCLFASAAVAASSQHAAYSAPPGALFGMAHAGKGLEGKGNKAHGHGMLIKRNRADTFDMESTMNIVSAHVGGLQRQEQRTSFDLTNAAERTRTFQCSTVTLPTPRATMWERMYELRRENDTAQLVSGSEPSTSSATTETESGNGSSSGKASPNCSEPSDHSEDSSSCCSDIMSDDESDSHLLHHHHTHKTKKARIGAGDVDETFAAPGAGNQAYTL